MHIPRQGAAWASSRAERAVRGLRRPRARPAGALAPRSPAASSPRRSGWRWPPSSCRSPRACPARRSGLILLAYLWSFAGLVLGTAAAARLLQRRRPGHACSAPAASARATSPSASPSIALLGALSAPRHGARSRRPVRQLPLAAWAAWLPLVAAGAPRPDRRRGARLPRLPAAGPRRPLPLAAGLVAAPRGPLRRSCTGTRPSSARTPGSSRSPPPSSASSSPTSPSAPATSRPRIGLHFANNVASLLVVALPSPLAGLSLYLRPHRPRRRRGRPPLLLADLATTLAAYAAWLALAPGAGDCIRGARGSI